MLKSFTESGNKSQGEPLWQDRDVRFDAAPAELRHRAGEKVIRIFERVEDTKGNNGDYGAMSITTLRLIWQSRDKPRINLTIGLGNYFFIALFNQLGLIFLILRDYDKILKRLIFWNFKPFLIEKNQSFIVCIYKCK